MLFVLVAAGMERAGTSIVFASAVAAMVMSFVHAFVVGGRTSLNGVVGGFEDSRGGDALAKEGKMRIG